MSFFQNPFDQEFRGSVPFGDRQYSLTFVVPPNKNTSQAMIAWNLEPYDLSTYTDLTINFAIDTKDFKNYSAITVDVAAGAADSSAVKAVEIVDALNTDPAFSSWFVASVVDSTGKNSNVYRVGIKAKQPKQSIRTYVSNTGAEKILRINKYAGVAELPTYFARHTIANRFTFEDSLAALIQLDESDTEFDQPIITDAGFDYSAMQADWQLLKGRVGLFNFQKITVDSSDRITEIIEYPAGSVAGALGRKTNYVYDNGHTKPSQITEIPYTISDSDLVTPA